LGDLVLDGELVALRGGRPAFAALQSYRGRRAGDDTQILFIAWDLLAVGDQDWRRRPLSERRTGLLERLPAGPHRIQPVPATTDPDQAERWWRHPTDLIEGIVLKPLAAPYRPGYASGWLKLRRTHTVELVVLGVTGRGRTTALVLGAPDEGGRPRAVGVSLPLPSAAHRELAPLLRPSGDEGLLPGVVGGLPGAESIPYQPVHPDTVVEVATDLTVA
jgi:ATP-dependent DNA ligase